MGEVIVYLSAGLAFLSFFPLHVYNYVYFNSARSYLSVNIAFFRYIKVYNINTVKNKPGEMQVNGKSKKINAEAMRRQGYNIFNQLCIYKIVQLTDFGMEKTSNAYIALTHNALTTAVYKFLQINGNYSKLKNYTVLNDEHDEIHYYMKMVTVVNALVIFKIYLIYLWGKLHAIKNQKEQGK